MAFIDGLVVIFYEKLYTSQSVTKTIAILIGIYYHCKAYNHQLIRFRCDDPAVMT
jgi:hypothetical protein